MNPLLIKYGLMALAFIGWTAGVYFYATGHEARIWKLAAAQQEVIASTLLNNAYAEKAAKEREDSDNARKVDEQHAKDLATADAGRDDFAKRLRNALSRKSSCGTASSQASDPGIGQNTTGSGDSGSGESNFEAGRKLREYALDLQRYSRACHAWATSVGQ